jgi:hypothetical protein
MLSSAPDVHGIGRGGCVTIATLNGGMNSFEMEERGNAIEGTHAWLVY